MSFEWKGDKALTAAERGRKKGLYEAAITVQNRAYHRCTWITGNLRNSISISVEGGSPELGKGEVVGKSPPEVAVIGTNVEYAARIEFGFEGVDKLGREYDQQGQPYLTPAFNETKREAKEMLRNAMREELERG